MNSLQVSLVLFGLILAVGVQSGHGIKCYVCNSHESYEGENCANDLYLEDFEKDCDTMFGSNNYTYCRKIRQSVMGEERIVRQCAIDARDGGICIERTGTLDIKITYCECAGDLCNTAAGFPHTQVALLTVVSALLAFIFHS